MDNSLLVHGTWMVSLAWYTRLCFTNNHASAKLPRSFSVIGKSKFLFSLCSLINEYVLVTSSFQTVPFVCVWTTKTLSADVPSFTLAVSPGSTGREPWLHRYLGTTISLLCSSYNSMYLISFTSWPLLSFAITSI